MDAETLEALKGSIRKWEAIAEGTGKDQGPYNCPLCLKFNSGVDGNEKISDSCLGCPVREKTGFRFCAGSPYASYEEAEELEDDAEMAVALSSAAKAELAFLRSLLPSDVA